MTNAGPLLDLAFVEFDVLAQDRIVFPDLELLRHRARVLLRDVIESGAAAAVQLDLGGGGLGHNGLQVTSSRRAGNLATAVAKSRQAAGNAWIPGLSLTSCFSIRTGTRR